MHTDSYMCNYYRFPCSNGNLAWDSQSLTIEEAAIEDMLWRKIQTDPHFTENVVKTMWPSAHRKDNEMIISPDLRVSLHLESCGAYCDSRARSRLHGLLGNDEDIRHIKNAFNYTALQGYYPGPLLQIKKGWLPHTVVDNILRQVRMRLTSKDRYFFDQKAGHRQVLMSQRDRKKAEKVLAGFYPATWGYKPRRIYWYTTENNATAFGVIYFSNDAGDTVKLPVTAWERMDSRSGNVSYDALHPHSLYPLYDLDKLVQFPRETKYVVICQDELTVEHIKKNHGWIAGYMPITTYSNIKGTDWGILHSMTPIILPESSANGCEEAFRLSAALEQQRFKKPLFIARQAAGVVGSIQFHQDVGKIAYPRGECALPEFAEHSQRVFDVTPPAGILPQAVSILSLPEDSGPPEFLLEGLLRHKELMMLFAWRGVGKSLFALFLAIYFASAKTAFGGRVCPSRKYRTLLLDAEMSPEILRKRAGALCRGNGLPESAAAEVKVLPAQHEKKELKLDTEAGRKDLEADLAWAEVIIVDSLFKLFPSAMTSEFSGTAALQNFFDWCRKHKKTLIIIDHEGKRGSTSFGSMGKEIGLDVVIQLVTTKGVTQVKVTKSRNHASHSGSWLQYRIATCDKGNSIRLEASESVHNNNPVNALPADENAIDTTSSEEPHSAGLDEVIIEYIKENPDQSQGEIATALQSALSKGRSTVHASIKALREAGKLPFWRNPPKMNLAVDHTPASGEDD